MGAFDPARVRPKLISDKSMRFKDDIYLLNICKIMTGTAGFMREPGSCDGGPDACPHPHIGAIQDACSTIHQA